MSDLALVFTEHGDFDLVLSHGDLLGDNGLASAVTVSLFSDRPARPDDALPEYSPGQKSDPRGWWADLLRDDGRANPIGSRLWLLGREKVLPETVAKAQEYAAECLSWLAVSSVGEVRVAASDGGSGRLKIETRVRRAGQPLLSINWTIFLDYSVPRVVRLLGVE